MVCRAVLYAENRPRGRHSDTTRYHHTSLGSSMCGSGLTARNTQLERHVDSSPNTNNDRPKVDHVVLGAGLSIMSVCGL